MMLKDKFVPVLLQSKDKDPNQQFINCTYLKTFCFLTKFWTAICPVLVSDTSIQTRKSACRSIINFDSNVQRVPGGTDTWF